MSSEPVLRLGIVGPQFAEPTLFTAWLARTFCFQVYRGDIGDDRLDLSKVFMANSRRLTLRGSVPAYAGGLDEAFRHVLQESDVAVLVLVRAKGSLHLNPPAVTAVERWGGPTVVAINDPYCRGAGHHEPPASDEFDMVPEDQVRAQLHRDWPVFATRIGSFDPQHCQCEEGARGVLDAVLEHFDAATSRA